jgi:hypothetical protein
MLYRLLRMRGRLLLEGCVIGAGGTFSLSLEYFVLEKAATASDAQDDPLMTMGRMSLHGVACYILLMFIFAACLLRCLRYELLFFVNT